MSKTAKLALVAVALWFAFGRPKTASAKMVTVTASSGPRTAKFSSYEGDVKTWAQKRYALALHYFMTYWNKALDADGAHDAALSVLAHWSLETNSGQAESNFNVGNLHAFGTQPYFSSGDTDEAGKGYTAAFASYKTLDDGIKAYFDLLESSAYQDCLGKLTAAPAEADWYKCLGEHGYFAKTIKGKDNLGPAAKGWAARRALLAQYATA